MSEKRPPDRAISGQKREEDQTLDGMIRPQQLSQFTGQEKLKANLTILLQAAQSRQEPVDHVLFHGPPGLGKTTLAHIIAQESLPTRSYSLLRIMPSTTSSTFTSSSTC